MTNEVKKVPELRFPEFGGEWEEKKLGDIGSVAMNKRIYKNETTNHGEIPFYKIGTFGKKAETFISREKFEEYKEKYPYPNKGDILISASGSIGRTVEYDGEEAYYQDSNIVWLQHNNEVLNVFLKYFYLIVKWNGIEGTTIKRLYNKNILNTKIELPVKEEQQKIGEFFSKLDRQIELEEQKLAKLEEQKKGYMQKIFSQELQFKDKITNNLDNWSEFKIKDIFSKIESGNRLPKNNLLDGDIPYVIAQTTNNGVYMNISKDTLDYHGNNLKKFKKGSITISIDNPDAMFIQTHDFVTSNVMRVLYNENLSIEAHTFILYSLRKLTQTYNWSVKFSGPIIMESKIKLPVKLNTNDINWNIVNKIGEFLNKLDFKIYQNTTKIELLKQRKKGLLQKMFV
ncbi:restriction endonuclease subunit S [Staphylococcus haemolyticus]|nr:restriction endonuclease subunit S [Staphylococcus haemolyticus]